MNDLTNKGVLAVLTIAMTAVILGLAVIVSGAEPMHQVAQWAQMLRQYEVSSGLAYFFCMA